MEHCSIKEQNELLKNICEKIVRSVNLEDEGTRKLFSPFFYYIQDLKDKYKINVLDYWKRAIEYKYWNVFKLWDNELPKDNITDLDLNGYYIGDDGCEAHCRVFKGNEESEISQS